MDKNFIFKVALVTIISFYFVILQFDKGEPQNSVSSSSSQNDKVLTKLNKELKMIHQINKIKKMKNKNESHALGLPQESLNTGEDEDTSKYGLDSRMQNQFEEVYKDFIQKSPDTTMDIDDMISKRVNDKKWLDEYQKEKNKAYIESFIENARKSGYQIVVDQDNEVKSVRRIRPKGYSAPSY